MSESEEALLLCADRIFRARHSINSHGLTSSTAAGILETARQLDDSGYIWVPSESPSVRNTRHNTPRDKDD